MKSPLVFISLFFLLLFPFIITAQITSGVKPIHSIAVYLSQGTDIKNHLLISGNQSPHTFFLKPSHLKTIYASKLLIFVDENTLETQIAKITAELPKGLSTLKLIDYIKPGLPIRSDENWHETTETGAIDDDHDDEHDEDDHDDEHDEDDHDDEHDEDEHDDEHNDEHGHEHMSGEIDPHVWLSVKNAKTITDVIADEIIRLFPKHASTVSKNRVELIKSLDELDSEIHKKFNKNQKKPFMVFHDAYQYFEHEYHIESEGVLYFNVAVPLSAKHYKSISHRIESKKIACLFAEPQFEQKTIKKIAEQFGLTVYIIDPLGSDIPAGTDFYEKLMLSVTDNFLKCFNNN